MSLTDALAADLRSLAAQASLLADLVEQSRGCDPDALSAASQAVASSSLLLDEMADQVGAAVDPVALAAA